MHSDNLYKATVPQSVLTDQPTKKFLLLTQDHLKKEYQKFLEYHGFTEMNFPFTSFLSREEFTAGIEAGAL